MNEINVTIVKYPDRENLVMRYTDPLTGRHKARSTGTSNKGDAHKAAGDWQSKLREERYHSPSRITWAQFRQRYEDECLDGLAQTTERKVVGIFDMLESIISLKFLRELNADRISHFQKKRREQGVAPSTIAGDLRHLMAALNWAVEMELLPAAPKVKKVPRAKNSKLMKGRPINLEEFERMLDKVGSVVGADAASSWRHYLQGLWLSGLRLAESLDLWWNGDGRDDRLCVDLSGKRPMLRIPASMEKGNEDRLLPITQEFAEFLLETPEDQRKGPVFNPKPLNTTKGPGRKVARVAADRACHLVSKIGKAAGIKVHTKTKADKETGKPVEVVKYASAHDLRRSFGERWATRVMPQVLMVLMRHDNIETTMKYYVGRNAETMADAIWNWNTREESNKPGNTRKESKKSEVATSSQA